MSFSDPAFSTPDTDCVPVTVMLSPTQAVLLELILARMVEKYGAIGRRATPAALRSLVCKAANYH